MILNMKSFFNGLDGMAKIFRVVDITVKAIGAISTIIPSNSY